MPVMKFKLPVIRSAFWLCVIFGTVSVTHWWTSSSQESRGFLYQANHNLNFKLKKKALIIVTYHRSGSSFLSQYFNQRNDTFFIYEPLLPFGLNCTNESDDRPKVEYLRNLIKCEIEDQKELSKKSGAVNDEKLMELLEENCFRKNMCFRNKMRSLCTKEFCKVKHTPTCVLCEPVNTTLASKKCKLADIVVIKVIRVCSIKNLKPLLEDPELDVKILELIRDPRGVHASREKLEKEYLSQDVSSTCNKIVKNRELVKRSENQWIKENYRILRYEDLCQYPLKMGHQIYRFVGLKMTSAMEQWIIANTQGDLSYSLDIRAHMLVQEIKFDRIFKSRLQSADETDHIFTFPNFSKILDEEPIKETIFNDPYTTIRNSSANWRKWTTEMDFRTVASVQRVCLIMMSTFHYLPILDRDQLKDSSNAVIQKFCPSVELTLRKSTDC